MSRWLLLSGALHLRHHEPYVPSLCNCWCEAESLGAHVVPFDGRLACTTAGFFCPVGSTSATANRTLKRTFWDHRLLTTRLFVPRMPGWLLLLGRRDRRHIQPYARPAQTCHVHAYVSHSSSITRSACVAGYFCPAGTSSAAQNRTSARFVTLCSLVTHKRLASPQRAHLATFVRPARRLAPPTVCIART